MRDRQRAQQHKWTTPVRWQLLSTSISVFEFLLCRAELRLLWRTALRLNLHIGPGLGLTFDPRPATLQVECQPKTPPTASRSSKGRSTS